MLGACPRRWRRFKSVATKAAGAAVGCLRALQKSCLRATASLVALVAFGALWAPPLGGALRRRWELNAYMKAKGVNKLSRPMAMLPARSCAVDRWFPLYLAVLPQPCRVDAHSSSVCNYDSFEKCPVRTLSVIDTLLFKQRHAFVPWQRNLHEDGFWCINRSGSWSWTPRCWTPHHCTTVHGFTRTQRAAS